jgi:hypothetical protein
MSVKERVSKQLKEGGSISSADLGSFQQPETPEEQILEEGEKVDPMTTTDIVDVPDEAREDIAMAAADRVDAPDVIAAALRDNPSGMLMEQGKVELSPEDKSAFLDAIVSNARYERQFSLFDGRLNGVFRSRLNRESRAILLEMRRELAAEELQTNIEYTTRLRHALLLFQLKELNGVEFPPPTEPLMAQSVVEDGEDGKPKQVINPPKWVTDCEVLFEGDEARTAALYNELAVFEARYWAMVASANDQDFWKTEDSTSE